MRRRRHKGWRRKARQGETGKAVVASWSTVRPSVVTATRDYPFNRQAASRPVCTPQTVDICMRKHARTRQAGIRACKGPVMCQRCVFPNPPRICQCRPRRSSVTSLCADDSDKGRSAFSLAYRCGGSRGMGGITDTFTSFPFTSHGLHVNTCRTDASGANPGSARIIRAQLYRISIPDSDGATPPGDCRSACVRFVDVGPSVRTWFAG